MSDEQRYETYPVHGMENATDDQKAALVRIINTVGDTMTDDPKTSPTAEVVEMSDEKLSAFARFVEHHKARYRLMRDDVRAIESPEHETNDVMVTYLIHLAMNVHDSNPFYEKEMLKIGTILTERLSLRAAPDDVVVDRSDAARERIRSQVTSRYNSAAQGAIRFALAEYDDALFAALKSAPDAGGEK